MRMREVKRHGWAFLTGLALLACTETNVLTPCSAPLKPAAPATAPIAEVKTSPAGATESTEIPDGPVNVVIYYFHGATRRRTCLDIEQYSREVVFDGFSGQLTEGRLEWRSINYDVPENQHYSADFHLPFPSLVFVKTGIQTRE